jgi:hypothetical protein
MIEVIRAGDGWTWRMIGADGRVLVYTAETWPEDGGCFAAAKAYRTAFWAAANRIDHRMGACI